LKKTTRRFVIAFALMLIMVLTVTGSVMAAGPNNGDDTTEGAGQQTKTQTNTATSCQNQLNNQFNASGHCNANQHCLTYRHGYGLTAE